MVEFTQIEAGELFDLLQPVNERVAVYEQLSARFGNVQVVVEKGLNGHQRFAVERFERPAAEHLGEEHFAKRRGKLVNQPRDAEAFVVDGRLLGVEHLADLQRDLRVLERVRQLLDAADHRADADGDLQIKFAGHGVDDALRVGLDALGLLRGFQFLDEHDVVFAHADDIVAALVGEHILNDFKRNGVAVVIVESDQVNDAVDLAVQMQFLGLQINVARKDVIENDVFDKVRFVVFLVVQRLDAGEGNGQQTGDVLGVVPRALDENDILRLPVRAERLIGVPVVHDRARGIGDRLEHQLVGLADAGKLAAGNDDALVVDHADGAVKLFFHLIDKALEQFV